MDFWDLTKLLFRRWYVAGPLLLLTIAGTVAAAVSIKPDYVATSYVQLVPPAVTPKMNDGKAPQPRNPWLDLGVSSLGKASILTVQDQKVAEGLADAGYSDNFTLTLDSSLPIVTFEVIGRTKVQASATSEVLIKRFAASAASLQNEYGAAADQSISTRRLDLGNNLTESTSKVKRALVAIAACGLLVTVAVTIAADALLRRRAGRRTRDPQPRDPQAGDPRPGEVPTGGDTPVGAVPQVVRQRAPRAEPVDPVHRPESTELTTVLPHGEQSTVARGGEETTVLRPGEQTVVLRRPEDATIILPQRSTPPANGKRR